PTTRTDAAGAFRLARFPAEPAPVDVEASGFLRWSGQADARTRLVVTLARGGLLHGAVKDADGSPAADVDVEIVRDGAAPTTAEIDDRGAFEARLAAGRVRVVARRDGKAVAEKEVELRDGETTSVE